MIARALSLQAMYFANLSASLSSGAVSVPLTIEISCVGYIASLQQLLVAKAKCVLFVRY